MILVSAGLFVAATFAYAAGMFCGGGAGLILMPLLGRVLTIGEVPVALTIGTTASALSRIQLFRDHVRGDIVRRFVPAAIPGAVLGTCCLRLVDPHVVELLMGLFLVANLPALFRRDDTCAPRAMSPGRVPLIGFAAGFVSGLTGAVGLLFNGCYFRLGLKKEEIVATRAANELLLHLVKLACYLAFGIFTARACSFGLLVGLAAVAATLLMRAVMPHVRDVRFRYAGYVAMVASGVALLSTATDALISKKTRHDATDAPAPAFESVRSAPPVAAP